MGIDASILLGYRPQQTDPSEGIGRMISLKQMMDEAPIRRQLQQQQVQAGQNELDAHRLKMDAHQRSLRDQEAIQAVFRETGGDMKAALPKLSGLISPDSFITLQKQDMEYRKSLAAMRKDELDAEKFHTEQTSTLVKQIASMTPEQYAANLPAAIARYKQLNPDGADLPADLPQAEWSTLGLGLQSHAHYLAQVDDDRKAELHPEAVRKAKAEATSAEQKATGTEPVTPYQFEQIRMDADENARRADHDAAVLAETRRAHNLTDARARVTNQQGGTQVEKTLRDDYNKAAAPFVVARDAYGRVRESLSSQDPMSDVALIYGYMKMLDPGSVVRETEFATAQNAAGVPDKIRNWFNNAREGIRLSGAQRKEIELMSDRLYKRAEADHNKTAEQYRGIATRSGANPANVLIDYSTTAPPQAGGAPAAPQQNSPASPLSNLSTDELFRKLQQNGR